MKDLVFGLCMSEGISGNENKAAEFALEKLKEYAKAERLPNGSVVACLGNENANKRILLDAHIDQVGFVVTDIDDKGFIKFASCGGNDRRIMPGSVVRVFGKEEVIGQISAQENGNDIEIRDIGWFIDEKYQNNGYASEAAKAMIDYMFKEVRISKILSGAVKDNIPSCKIFEKLGFKKICEVEEISPYTFYDGLLTFSKYELMKDAYFTKK